jgi:hypothetical protein
MTELSMRGLTAILAICAVTLSACGGPPPTEAERLALIGVWAPVGKYEPGVTLLKEGHIVIYENGDFHYYVKEGYIAGRTWTFPNKTTLELTSGNNVKVTCSIELGANTLKISRDGGPCAAHDGDNLYGMAKSFFKAVQTTPLN